MLRVLWSHPSSIADVFTRAFYFFPPFPSEAVRWWHHKMCCLGQCRSTTSSISVQSGIFLSLGGKSDGLYDLKCWWISKTSSACIVNRSKPWTAWKGFFIPCWENRALSLFFSSVVPGHGKFACYSCAKQVGINSWYVTRIWNCNKNSLLDPRCTPDQKGFLCNCTLSTAMWLQRAAAGKITASAERFGKA